MIDLKNTADLLISSLKSLKLDKSTWQIKHYSEDFEDLWLIGKEETEKIGEKVLILWDGYPENFSAGDSEISLAGYLTPIDWALAHGKESKVIILDVCSHQMGISDFDFHLNLLKNMEWVRFYSFNYNNSSDKANDFKDVIHSPLEISESSTGWKVSDEGGAEQARENLVTGWLSNLRKSADKDPSSHHSVNNILGPMFLLKEHKSLQRKAFRQCLEWLNIVNKEVEPLILEDDCNILVIDDKLDAGWGGVLQKMFGTNQTEDQKKSKAIMILWEDPDKLVNLLRKDIDKVYSNRFFDSQIKIDEDDKTPWIIILDLHLYSDKKAECQFFKDLLKVAKPLENAKNLAWYGFNSSEIDILDTWLNSSNEQAPDEQTENIALSLLPRLCALRWPAIPIFLFSVTCRRNLIAKLTPYKNIFLAHNKPDFLGGDPKNQIDAFNNYWENEWQSAIKLIKVQEQLINLSKRESLSSKSSSNNGSNGKFYHLVIALDETGKMDKITAIGGVILVSKGDNEKEAKNLSYEFQEELRKNYINYYHYPPYYSDCKEVGTEIKEHIIKKKGSLVYDEKQIETVVEDVLNQDNYKNIETVVEDVLNQDNYKNIETVVEDVLNQDNYKNVKLGFFEIPLDTNRSKQPKDHAFIDHRYVCGLSNLIEIILAEFLSSTYFFSRNSTTISLWIPSKQIPDNDNSGHDVKFDLWKHAAGKDRKEYQIETIGGRGSAYSVLLRALGERTVFQNVLKSIQLKTRKIPYMKTDRGFEDVLDWVCSNKECELRSYSTRVYTYASYPPNCKKCGKPLSADYSIMQHLADEILDRSSEYKNTLSYFFQVKKEKKLALAAFLQSARLFDQGFKNESFKQAYTHQFFKDMDTDKIESRLVEKLKKHAKSLKGDDIQLLSHFNIDA